MHGPMVKAACHRILGDAALAEDAAQEVFLLLVRKLPSLPSQTILGGWLYVTACRLARTHRRTQARRWQRENQPEALENLMNPAQDTLWRELEPLLDDAMLSLSERQREVVQIQVRVGRQSTVGNLPTPVVTKADNSQSTSVIARAPATASTLSSSTPRPSVLPAEAKAPVPVKDDAALKAGLEKLAKFQQRISQLALMTDTLKVQEQLLGEYGIRLSVEEIRALQERGPKGFSFGVIENWAGKQPQEALAWAASTFAGPNNGGVDFHQLFLDAARKALPNLNRDTLDGILPEGPGKAKLLDLAEASMDPGSLASRVLAVTDPEERASRLKVLAQGWSNPETSVEWARHNLTGSDKAAFYSQVGYNLAHQNPRAALQVLAELEGTDSYASTFSAMMRGLVQEGGMGQQASELIAHANLNARERADLISELARRWVRQDADATVAWVNSLTAQEDFRAAIPLLVSQLDNDRVSRTVAAYLQNLDPVMELALIEAAAPSSLYFDPQKSRLILDPLISRDPALKIAAGEENGSSREEMLWNAVNLSAKRQAEASQPAAAMEWLATLPFANPSDYAKAAANVLTVWNLKSHTDAADWLQNSSLTAALKADLQKAVQP
jgi:RNA polymerase sigma factor (sigma-70 family)